ncbi:MAG: hypothetical protein HC903_29735 [Methylacidiphilales bacterium]|nr:hypothetical protein [Candidatus Methylacidiphilales bacterium]
MDSQIATQVSSEFESALSVIMPDLAQLLQQYQVSGVLKAELTPAFNGCTYPNGIPSCTALPSGIEFVYQLIGFGEEQDTEIVQKFWTDIASKLFELETLLNQSIKKWVTALKFDSPSMQAKSILNRQ